MMVASEIPKEVDGDSAEVWCPICEMWLNGPCQWEDHKIGKKHKKNDRKQRGGVSEATTPKALLIMLFRVGHILDFLGLGSPVPP